MHAYDGQGTVSTVNSPVMYVDEFRCETLFSIILEAKSVANTASN